MKVKLPLVFSQWDSRWASKLLGFNTAAQYNFYNYACLICCLAMLSRYYGKDESPVSINDRLKALGAGKGFTTGSGNYVWGGIHLIFGDIKENLTRTPSPLTDDQLNQIRSSLDAGHPVMFQIDVNPRTVANDQHWVLCVDYDPNDENNFTIADPLGGKIRSLKDYLGWFRPGARNTIEAFVLYEGPKPQNVGMIQVPEDIYPNIIHGSTEWDKTVAEYLKNNDPKQTHFEDVRSVVSGYKSRITSLENDLRESKKEVEKWKTEVENQKDKSANQLKQCQDNTKLISAELQAKTKALKTLQDTQGSYTTRISELQGDLREAQKQVGKRDLTITGLKSDLKACQAGVQTLSCIEQVINWLKSIWEK